MADQFDYIVVGGMLCRIPPLLVFLFALANTEDILGGTAGCLLSYQLAAAAPERSILLLERGGANSDVSLYNPYDKYTAPFREDVTEEKYTTPQRALDGRSLPYYVGRGLGGTGIINTMVWHYGCDADFDRWADCVGDQTWSWENVKQGFKKVGKFVIDGTLQILYIF
jgi:choline dehydrogenase-like flavoprotein